MIQHKPKFEGCSFLPGVGSVSSGKEFCTMGMGVSTDLLFFFLFLRFSFCFILWRVLSFSEENK